MKTLKVMSFIGLLLSALAFIAMFLFNDAEDYEHAIGWEMVLATWTIAQSIVGLIQSIEKQVK